MKTTSTRTWAFSFLLVAAGCGGGRHGDGDGGNGVSQNSALTLPQVYPPIRANTPASLIADPAFSGGSGSKDPRHYWSGESDDLAMVTPDMAGQMFGPPDGGGMLPIYPDGGGMLPIYPDGGGMFPIYPDGGGMPPLGDADGGSMGGMFGESLAQIVRDRLYTMGPTEILSLLKDLDGRTSTLDTDPDRHPCLTATPVPTTYTLPGGETFTVQLQCMMNFNGMWMAFGFSSALAADDAGADDQDAGPNDQDTDDASVNGLNGTMGGGNDFYLIEGMTGGMGGAYHIDRASGDVEGWLSVADRKLPNSTQALMHLYSSRAAATLELTLAGIGDGFCAAHLKVDADHLFIRARTPQPGMIDVLNAAPQLCNAVETGCFATANLDTDLGGGSAACSAVGSSAFTIPVDLDASSDSVANVQYSTIYTYFIQPPVGVPSF